MNNIQLRGNCPCCGNLQAVTNGGISKHGYTVQHGWFQGVCPGEGKRPLQVERTVAEKIISDVRADVATLEDKLALIEAGKILPKTITRGQFRETTEVPYAEGTSWEQERALAALVWATKGRIKAGNDFANDLETILNRVHGTPLVEVEKKAPTAPICKGEQKINNGRVITARYQQGARVYYRWIRDNGTAGEGWIGTQAWRKLEAV